MNKLKILTGSVLVITSLTNTHAAFKDKFLDSVRQSTGNMADRMKKVTTQTVTDEAGVCLMKVHMNGKTEYLRYNTDVKHYGLATNEAEKIGYGDFFQASQEKPIEDTTEVPYVVELGEGKQLNFKASIVRIDENNLCFARTAGSSAVASTTTLSHSKEKTSETDGNS